MGAGAGTAGPDRQGAVVAVSQMARRIRSSPCSGGSRSSFSIQQQRIWRNRSADRADAGQGRDGGEGLDGRTELLRAAAAGTTPTCCCRTTPQLAAAGEVYLMKQ